MVGSSPLLSSHPMQAAQQMDGPHHHLFCFIYLWDLARGAKEEGGLNGVTRVLQRLMESNRCAAAGPSHSPLQFINAKMYARRNSQQTNIPQLGITGFCFSWNGGVFAPHPRDTMAPRRAQVHLPDCHLIRKKQRWSFSMSVHEALEASNAPERHGNT